jgi:hypothetical protein
MKTKSHFSFAFIALAATLIGFCPLKSEAGYIVTLDQVGSNVVAAGSGALDLTGLGVNSVSNQSPDLFPQAGTISTGSPAANVVFYTGSISGPGSFGSGSDTPANSGTGDFVGRLYLSGNPEVLAPSGYANNSPLSSSATWNNATFSSLGVIPGTYEWTWGTGANQNFTLQIGPTSPATVPDAGSTWTLLLLGLMVALGVKSFARRLAFHSR